MIEYEVEQKLIKDIMWLEKTKQAYVERKARNERYKQQKAEREAERKKQQEEREARKKKYEEEQARRKEEEAERQRQWEAQQLKRVEINPYNQDIDICEQLIYYCSRTQRQHQKDDTNADDKAEESNDNA